MIYNIFLKQPNGKNALSISNNSETWSIIENIELWLEEYFTKCKCHNRIYYNDAVLNEHVDSYNAHAKGILVYDDKTIKWLIHSVPNWPSETFKFNSIIYGQSFILMELPIIKLKNIIDHLEIMDVNIYYNTTPFTFIKSLNKLDICEISQNIYHIAKSKEWYKDLFDDELSDLFGGNIAAETWMRPVNKDTQYVNNIEEIKWPNGIIYSESQDHSKYCFSLNKDKPWVFIGDINHQASQSKRGGGGIMIKNITLWNAFYSLIAKL